MDRRKKRITDVLFWLAMFCALWSALIFGGYACLAATAATAPSTQPAIPPLGNDFYLSRTSVPTNIAIFVSAWDLAIPTLNANDFACSWDFGDSQTVPDPLRYSTGGTIDLGHSFPGMVAAHRYLNPGTYSVRLTIQAFPSHQAVKVITKSVIVTAAGRNLIYVNAATGKDTNNGPTAALAFKSIDAASKRLANNTELVLAPDQEFDYSNQINAMFTNVVIGTPYGAASSTLKKITPGAMIATAPNNTNGFTLAGVKLDCNFTTTEQGGATLHVAAANVGHLYGKSICFADVQCGNGGADFAMGTDQTDGLYLLRCNQVEPWGLKGRFLWLEGQHIVMAGCRAVNSIAESSLRANASSTDGTGAHQIGLVDNYIGQLTGLPGWGTRKAAMVLHYADRAWIEGNLFANAEASTASQGGWPHLITNVVMRGNGLVSVTAGDTDGCFNISGGSSHITLQNNTAWTLGVAAYNVHQNPAPPNGDARLGVSDIVLSGNLAFGDKHPLNIDGAIPRLSYDVPWTASPLASGGASQAPATQPSH